MENIKILRERTGAGMVDCQQALKEANNDLEKAVDLLRKKGIAKAAKRSEREAGQGVIKAGASADQKSGVIVEVNAETDFVARNQQFQDFAQAVCQTALTHQPADVQALLALTMADNNTVQSNLNNLSGVIGEKLAISRCASLQSAGTVNAYVHATGHLAVLVSLDQPGQAELARGVAMHIAAANPLYIKPEDAPQTEIDKEKEVYSAQLLKEGKPKEMIDKIMSGKINKYYEEVCLIKQEYIKDDKKKVADILGSIQVEKFIRYSL